MLRAVNDDLDPTLRAELDARARALGQEARAALIGGDLLGAHRLQVERLGLNQRIDDEDGIAACLYELGCVEVRLGRRTDALNHLGESLDRFLESRRADGIAVAGFQLGVVLVEVGRAAEATQALVESRDAYAFLEQADRVREIEGMLERMSVGEG